MLKVALTIFSPKESRLQRCFEQAGGVYQQSRHPVRKRLPQGDTVEVLERNRFGERTRHQGY
jgi:hypothetical protein